MKMRVTGAAALALATFTSASVLAQEAAAPTPTPEETGWLATKNFSSTIYLTTDYMFRGISNSDGPAIQGSIDYSYNGFYVGAWASNTEFSDGNFEIDYYGGYKWTWSDISFNLGGLYYTYPGEHDKYSEGYDPGSVLKPDAWYGEITVGASYTFTSVALAPSIGVTYNYSPDFFGSDGDGHAVQGTFGLSLPYGLSLYGNVGYQDVAGDKTTGNAARNAGLWTSKHNGYDYVWYGVGVNKTIKGFKLDLGYYGTDESKSLEAAYPNAPLAADGDKNFHHLIEGRVVFTVSRSF